MTDLTPHTLVAYNLSHASENRIHDDSVARSLGFSGGLVPGVEVYGYACHMPVAYWGSAFLARGEIMCRFFKPVYDGHRTDVTASPSDGRLDITVSSDGDVCAKGEARLREESGPVPSLPEFEPPLPPQGDLRPPANAESLAPGTLLGIHPETVDRERLQTYLEAVRETDPVYAREGLVHPGLLLRLCNTALKDNVRLAPWIHTGSRVRNYAAAHVGDELSVRGRVAANYERKGHRLVDLDLTLVGNGTAVLAHVLHTAIYALRPAGAS